MVRQVRLRDWLVRQVRLRDWLIRQVELRDWFVRQVRLQLMLCQSETREFMGVPSSRLTVDGSVLGHVTLWSAWHRNTSCKSRIAPKELLWHLVVDLLSRVF